MKIYDWGEKGPVIQIDPQFRWITPKGRRDINKWLLKTFGEAKYVRVVLDDEKLVPKEINGKRVIFCGFR